MTTLAISIGAILGLILSVLKDKADLHMYRNFVPEIIITKMFDGRTVYNIDVGTIPLIVADKIVAKYKIKLDI